MHCQRYALRQMFNYYYYYHINDFDVDVTCCLLKCWRLFSITSLFTNCVIIAFVLCMNYDAIHCTLVYGSSIYRIQVRCIYWILVRIIYGIQVSSIYGILVRIIYRIQVRIINRIQVRSIYRIQVRSNQC